MKKVKNFLIKYKHALPLVIYGIIYFAWFTYLEQTVTTDYRVIHMAIDDHIPFCEIFVIPYFLWFAYIAAVVAFLLFKDRREYCRACVFLFTGMTVFLVISTLWPNGHHLRPATMPRDNVFTRWIAALYRTDTATNLWPSIHVYNSIGAHIAVTKCRYFKHKPWIRYGSLVLSVSIILSTVFIKQHSMFDVLTAFAMAAIMYFVVYQLDIVAFFQEKHQTKTRPEAV